MNNVSAKVEDYLQYCTLEKKLDPKTIKSYRCDLSQFLTWLASEKRLFNRETLHAYIVALNAKFSVSSVKRKLASIRAFASYLEETESSDNPFRRLRISIKEPKRLPRTIPIETLNTLFKALYTKQDAVRETQYSQFRTARDRAIIELFIASGIRVAELCLLNMESINLSNKTIRIMGKGSKERIIQIENKNTIDSLERYVQTLVETRPEQCFQQEKPLFLNRFGGRISDQSVRNIIRHWIEVAGLSVNITPHMFRHTFATLLLENNVDIRYIQRFLGHSSITTTEIYTHVTSSKMRDILKTHNPRSALSIGE